MSHLNNNLLRRRTMFFIISVSLSVGNIAENKLIDFIRLSERIFQVTTRIQDYFSVCSIEGDLLMLALSRKDMKVALILSRIIWAWYKQSVVTTAASRLFHAWLDNFTLLKLGVAKVCALEVLLFIHILNDTRTITNVINGVKHIGDWCKRNADQYLPWDSFCHFKWCHLADNINWTMEESKGENSLLSNIYREIKFRQFSFQRFHYLPRHRTSNVIVCMPS